MNVKKTKRMIALGPVRLGQQFEVEIVGLTHDALGVCQVEGFTLFVSDAIPGDRVAIEVTKINKTYGFARLVHIDIASVNRIQPKCVIYDRCGGCQLQHMSYEAQLDWKRQYVTEQLRRIGKLDEIQSGLPVAVHPTIGMTEPWRYRNKVQLPVAGEGAGKQVILGFYEKNSHDVVDMDVCHIQHVVADEVVELVKRVATVAGVAPYDEARHTGCLRQVMVRVGYATGEVMVVFVTNGESFEQADVLVDALRRELPEVVSILQNINSRKTNVILGDVTRLLWGKETIEDEIGGIRFEISARSFFQVNPLQTEVLYSKVLEYAALTGVETVVDAYCGIGSITLFLAGQAAHVYAMEVVEAAVVDARRNAQLNGIDNVTFEVGAAEDVLPRWREQGVTADVMVVDPPRKGCDERLLSSVLEMKPKRLVYVSCNPATLARDVNLLVGSGEYQVVEVQPVDMFPQTAHVECVILMTRV